MSKNYTHLNLFQRYQMEAMLSAGSTQKAIAEHLSVSETTICRERKRNASKGSVSGYNAINAQTKTNQRHLEKAKCIKFTEAMKAHISLKMQVDKWSPELISAMGNKDGTCPISHERIYQWIWECKRSGKKSDKPYKHLYQHLKHGKRKRKRGNSHDTRGVITNRVSIEKRPLVVAKRKRLGDIEIDLMIGKDHKGAILVMTDRASLHTKLRKLTSKSAGEVTRSILSALNNSVIKPKTITFDNDKAFSHHETIAKALGAKAYFTRPYTSQDKGTVENRIGVLRRFFPKKEKLTNVKHQQVRAIENKLNNRPIRKFNYLSPNQVLQKKIALMT